MTLVRRLARPLLAAPFVAHGVDGFRHPGPYVDEARPVAAQVAKVASPLGLPEDPEVLVRVHGAAMAGSAALLALGRLPRLAGTVLAVTGALTLASHHRFWEEKDPERRREQRQSFVSQLGLLGGALLAAVDTQGRPGLAYRSRTAARSAERTAKRARKDARHATRLAKAEARSEARRFALKAQDVLPG